MTAASLVIASAQSAIVPDARANGHHIRELMSSARAAGARLIHFPEGALSGYVKAQIKSWDAVDWRAVREELEAIAAHAARLGLWTVLGCNHRLTPPHRPHNSLYVIADTGALIGRYDKRLCSNTEINGWYTPGTAPLVFEADGYRFGLALCIEIHFPHLFEEYERLGVDCVLFSAYDENPIFGIEAQAHAATNGIWLSISAPAECSIGLPCGVIGPDGHHMARAEADGRAAFVIGALDRGTPRYEIALAKARPWRARAKSGEAYRGLMVEDERSPEPTAF